MKNTSKDKKQRNKKQKSLVGRFKVRLFLTVGALICVFILLFLDSILVSIYQYNQGALKVTVHDDLDGLLNSMVDQETGLRGYITTNNPLFLQPLNTGRPQTLAYLQQLKNQTINDKTNKIRFLDISAALTQVEKRANEWYTNYAEVQIKNMQTGNYAAARSESTNATGQALFDRFRAAQTQLHQMIDHDLTSLQDRINAYNLYTTLIILVASAIAIVILWRIIRRFAKDLLAQLNTLQNISVQLGAGNLSSRLGTLAHKELNQVGQTINSMADALQQQQGALAERSEAILQLNTVLTSSLDLQALADEFLSAVLTSLELHLGALYLFDADRKQLTLFAAQGFDRHEIQKDFQLGEGTIGQAALKHEPLHLSLPTSDEVGGFKVKTMFGLVLPATSYYLPLFRGNELFGVLAVASTFPMHEKARDVLNVVVSTLATTLSNTRAYQHIQEQTRELELRSREQDRTNIELRRQRDELTILNSALEEANRARSQFLSTMSHELRTPLASIIGFSQIMLSDTGNAAFNQQQKNNLGRILKNGQHLLGLINDVLDLAKIEAGRMDVNCTQVDLSELLSSVVEETQSIAIKQKLVLRSSVEEGVDCLETDQVKLRQILLNLVSNALKFTEKGEVTVTASRVTPVNNGTGRVIIAVKDTGIGIAPEIQERIFEAFYQVESGSTRKFGGTGLGLSIVRELTTLLGGTLEVSSVPGQGSTFMVILPLKVENRQVAQDNLRLHSVPSQQPVPRLLPSSSAELPAEVLDELFNISGKKEATSTEQNLVLAVDDNPDVVLLIQSALEDSPYRVVGVQNSLKVMDMVHTLHPCAITLDVMMPELNGWQLLYQLKSDPATAAIPVVILTVLSERTTGYVLGADEYLIKPFEPDTLLNILQRLVTLKFPTQDSDLEAEALPATL